MKIHQLIRDRDVELELTASSVDEALNRIAEFLAAGNGLVSEAVAEALIERERLGTTAVGDGFAIPHCKLTGLNSIIVGYARFDRGIDFRAADGVPVTTFLIVLSPPHQPALHLQVLSQIARILKHEAVRDELRGAPDRAHVLEIVKLAAEAEGV